MKVLKIEVSCGKVRWIFSALSTLILVVLLLFFPFWNSMSATKAVTSSFEKGVSVVTVIKKKTLPLQKEASVQKRDKKIVRPEDNVIPEKKKEPVLEGKK